MREEIEISEYDRLNALKQALEEKIRVILEWEEYFMYKDLKSLLELKNEIEKKMGVLWENKMNIQHNKKNIIDLISFYDYKFKKAKVQYGGSSYLLFQDKNQEYEIRFADHSKRREHQNTILLKNYVFKKPEGWR